MVKRILSSLFLVFLCFVLFPTKIFAAGEFSSSYDVTYDVDDSGVTTVTENVSLKNLTDNYYASSFSLTIGSTKLSDVSAYDSSGPLDSTVSADGTKTTVNVKFNSQVAGLGKVYNYTLKFKSTDFAQAEGKTWQVSVPKISSGSEVDNYALTLSVPLDFGDPTSILPTPAGTSEAGGKINLNFNKDQLLNQGILANFGSNQVFSFHQVYHLSNNSLLSGLAKLPLPADTEYQQVEIGNINPKPENVELDQDGNYIAYFRLGRYQSLDVSVDGLAKLYINPTFKDPNLTASQVSDYTKEDKYWEVNNPLIKSKLSDIFKNGEPSSNKDKASLINQYVVNTLKYSTDKLKNGDFTRLGAVTVLNNPTDALCSEFTDLFIALARAAGIPSRELDGYAYTANQDLRPLSFKGDGSGATILHTWPEYFDPASGWVMIDPTWQNTTGGVDYFSKLDLNHFVLATKGESSIQPNTADHIDVSFSDMDFNPVGKPTINLGLAKELYSGFPNSMMVTVTNTGSAPLQPGDLSLRSNQIQILDQGNTMTSLIPPFGHQDFSYNLRTPNLWSSFDDDITVAFQDQKVDGAVLVRPFFAFKLFPAVIIGVVGLMFLIYGGVLTLHLKSHRKK